MSFAAEAVRSIIGAWRIARFDPQAMTYFNQSIDGFWRSFAAALIAIPLGMLTSFLVQAGAASETAPVEVSFYLFDELLTPIVIWAAFPLVMIPIARLIGLSATYVPFIIAWNWSQVIITAVMLPAGLIFGLELLGSQLSPMLLMMALVSVLFYSYLVARTALGCDTLTAIGIVVLDYTLSQVIALGSDRLLGALSAGSLPAAS